MKCRMRFVAYPIYQSVFQRIDMHIIDMKPFAPIPYVQLRFANRTYEFSTDRVISVGLISNKKMNINQGCRSPLAGERRFIARKRAPTTLLRSVLMFELGFAPLNPTYK